MPNNYKERERRRNGSRKWRSIKTPDVNQQTYISNGMYKVHRSRKRTNQIQCQIYILGTSLNCKVIWRMRAFVNSTGYTILIEGLKTKLWLDTANNCHCFYRKIATQGYLAARSSVHCLLVLLVWHNKKKKKARDPSQKQTNAKQKFSSPLPPSWLLLFVANSTIFTCLNCVRKFIIIYQSAGLQSKRTF